MTLLKRHVEWRDSNSYFLKNSQKMDIKEFDGLTFKPELYGIMLNKNLEYLGECELIKNFNSQQFLQEGCLDQSVRPCLFVYEQ